MAPLTAMMLAPLMAARLLLVFVVVSNSRLTAMVMAPRTASTLAPVIPTRINLASVAAACLMLIATVTAPLTAWMNALPMVARFFLVCVAVVNQKHKAMIAMVTRLPTAMMGAPRT
jgi:hypothetical protein